MPKNTKKCIKMFKKNMLNTSGNMIFAYVPNSERKNPNQSPNNYPYYPFDEWGMHASAVGSAQIISQSDLLQRNLTLWLQIALCESTFTAEALPS